MKAPRFKKIADGEVVQPSLKNYRMQCCDCGLVHRLDFWLVTKGNRWAIQFTAKRLVGLTKAARRSRPVP